jgi:hypothetical protein
MNDWVNQSYVPFSQQQPELQTSIPEMSPVSPSKSESASSPPAGKNMAQSNEIDYATSISEGMGKPMRSHSVGSSRYPGSRDGNLPKKTPQQSPNPIALSRSNAVKPTRVQMSYSSATPSKNTNSFNFNSNIAMYRANRSSGMFYFQLHRFCSILQSGFQDKKLFPVLNVDELYATDPRRYSSIWWYIFARLKAPWTRWYEWISLLLPDKVMKTVPENLDRTTALHANHSALLNFNNFRRDKIFHSSSSMSVSGLGSYKLLECDSLQRDILELTNPQIDAKRKLDLTSRMRKTYAHIFDRV